MPTQTGVTTQTISSTKMALATAFMGVAAMAAAAAGMMTSGPDLVIDNLSAANGTDLSAGVYSFTLKNIGSRPAKGPFYISFEAIGEVNGTLSTLSLQTADFEANGMKIMKLKETNIMKGIVIQVPSYLKAGDSIVFSGGLTLPSNTQKVHLFADSYNRVKELDEVNNGTEYTLVLPKVTCIDSDNGKNSSVKGVATHTFNSGLVVSYEDHCYTGNQNTVSVSSSDKLAEYYCGDDGYVKPSYNTTCEFGCFEGACVMTSSTYPVTSTTTASCTPYDTCNDNNPCTEDFCSPNTNACKNVPYTSSTEQYMLNNCGPEQPNNLYYGCDIPPYLSAEACAADSIKYYTAEGCSDISVNVCEDWNGEVWNCSLVSSMCAKPSQSGLWSGKTCPVNYILKDTEKGSLCVKK